MKYLKYCLLVVFFHLVFINKSDAQTKEINALWFKQTDTTKINPIKPMYVSITQNETIDLFNSLPNFGLYKDNYIITGVPTNKPISNETANAKFQVSIRQRLFNSLMPYKSFLMLTYTQKSFWDIYRESAPFYDINYNPGLLLVKPIINENHMKGVISFSIEHESNGRDSLENRSWNYFTVSGTYFFNYYFSFQAKVWYGIAGDDNSDLFDYRGYGLLGLNYRNRNDKLTASVSITPIKNFSVNTMVEISYQPNKRANQNLFIQWYNGFGENLLDYNSYSSMVRVGICIKSPLKNQL